MSKKISIKTKRDIISWIYFLLPMIVVYLHFCYGIIDGCWFRVIFPTLAGCWGLVLRGIYLRNHPDDPIPNFISLYPLAILMHGLLIYTVLSLFKPFKSHLFFTAAFPLGMYFGFYSHPSFWPLHLIFVTLLEKVKNLGDKRHKVDNPPPVW